MVVQIFYGNILLRPRMGRKIWTIPRTLTPSRTTKQIEKPCSLSQPLSWIKPMKGAMPVPGPTMSTGLVALKGRRNWDFRIYMGTMDLWPLSDISLFFSQLVATPLLTRPVFVSYSTTTAQIWILLGWTFRKEKNNHQELSRKKKHTETEILPKGTFKQQLLVLKGLQRDKTTITSMNWIDLSYRDVSELKVLSYLRGGGNGVIASLETR